MKRFSRMIDALGSPVVTILLGGLALVIYLTLAVWSKEAFSWMMVKLRWSIPAQVLAALFVVNVTIRFFASAMRLRRSVVRLMLCLPLYLGIVMFLVSFLLGNVFRESRATIIGSGDVIEVGSAGELTVDDVNPAMDEQVFQSEQSTGIFRYEPAVILRDRSGVRHRVAAYPPSRIGGVYLHVLNFGIGPGVELRKDGVLVAREYLALSLLPFGSADSFELPNQPYMFHLSILPVRTIMKGDRKVFEYDLKKPRYKVDIVRGDRTVFSGESRDSVAFGAGMRLDFLDPGHWVLLETVKDPFVIWFAAGLLLAAAGAVLYPFSWFGRKSLPLPAGDKSQYTMERNS